MKILGLTGGIGMGKTTVADCLQRRGIPVVDTDQIARDLVAPGQAALQEIRQAFGDDVIGPEGGLRREALARRVFADPARRRDLEAILHPRIRTIWRAQVQQWHTEGHPLAVVVIPLLFETQAEVEVDYVLCVACSPETQRQRLQARGWSSEQVEQRNRAQWPVEQKLARAHFVLWNEAGPAILADQLERILCLTLPR